MEGDREISELNNTIVSLTSKVKTIEALNESLQKSITKQWQYEQIMQRQD